MAIVYVGFFYNRSQVIMVTS